MAECLYCGTELPGGEEVCRACWEEKYAGLKRPTKPPTREDRLRRFIAAAPATASLIAANGLLYILTALAAGTLFPSAAQLVHFGADYLPQTLQGQWWRPITAMFLHAFPAHVIFNMLALAQLGSVAEPAIGRRRFLIVYFSGGLVSSLSSELWHPVGVSVGASGAIFGIIGLLIPLMIYRTITVKIRRGVWSIGSLVTITIYNLVSGAIVPEIDNAAHLGGFAFGLAAGLILAYRIAPQVVEFASDGTIRSCPVDLA